MEKIIKEELSIWPRPHSSNIVKEFKSFFELDIRLLTIWELRLDLQNNFNLSSEEGCCGFIAWWYWKGMVQYPNANVFIHPKTIQYILEPAEQIVQDCDLPITRLMYGLWSCFDHFWSEKYNLQSKDSRRALLGYWYFVIYSEAGGRMPEPQEVNSKLREPLPALTQAFNSAMVPTIGHSIWYSYIYGRDLDIKSSIDLFDILSWLYLKGQHDTQSILPRECSPLGSNIAGILKFFKEYEEMLRASGSHTSEINENDFNEWNAERLLFVEYSKPQVSVEVDAKTPADIPITKQGVNLIGYAKGELGIGEDVRCASNCLEVVGIEHSIYSYPNNKNIRHGEKSHDHRITDDNPFNVNIFCLPAIESSWAAIDLGEKFFSNRYNIGYWPWELERWPKKLSTVFSYFDEIWAPSEFIANALKNVSPVPVKWMTLSLPKIGQVCADRHFYGLPEDHYLFFFMFDFGSSYHRKNPLDILRAFQKAFPSKQEKVGLVFKFMNHKSESEIYREFESLINEDPRVFKFAGTMDKVDVLGLINVTDCFISLHRAEGFGRCIAEAMLLGKPTIATGYSGNMDFCKPEHSDLVEPVLKPINEDEYWYFEDQVWAYPNVAQAALYMRELFENKKRGSERGLLAKRWIESQHSPAVIGERYSSRLKEIFRQLS